MLRLPIATGAQGRAWARRTFRAHRGEFVAVSGLLGLATVTGLAGPQILGLLVDSVAGGGGRIDLLASLFVVVLLAQTILRRYARVRAGMLGERVLAETRENFVGQALRLPLGTVEAAGTGDLLSRATTDADRVDFAVRQAFPEVSVAVLTVLLTVVCSRSACWSPSSSSARRCAGTGRAYRPWWNRCWTRGRTCRPACTRRRTVRVPPRRSG